MAPGGKREFNEGLFEAAHREIKEETGLRIKNLRIRATGNGFLKDINQELFWHFIVADYAGGKLKNSTTDGELVWLTPKEILSLDNLLAEMKYVLPHVFGNKTNVISYKAVYSKGNKLQSINIETA